MDTSKATTPEAFAKTMGWSPKRVRRLAKKLGACRILGNRMALMPEDVEAILEATKPKPLLPIAAPSLKFYGASQVPTGDYAELLALRERLVVKFHSLADPVIGAERASMLQRQIDKLDEDHDIRVLMAA